MTNREWQIYQLSDEGNSNKEIAKVEPQPTWRRTALRIMEKLDLHGTAISEQHDLNLPLPGTYGPSADGM